MFCFKKSRWHHCLQLGSPLSCFFASGAGNYFYCCGADIAWARICRISVYIINLLTTFCPRCVLPAFPPPSEMRHRHQRRHRLASSALWLARLLLSPTFPLGHLRLRLKLRSERKKKIWTATATEAKTSALFQRFINFKTCPEEVISWWLLWQLARLLTEVRRRRQQLLLDHWAAGWSGVASN